MITDKTRKDLELACEKIHKGILAAAPAAEEAVLEMKRFDDNFNKFRESVRKQLESGARRTTNLPI